MAFDSESWLALVLGKRGEGFPVPGRTGGVQSTNEKTLHQSTTVVVAVVAFIVIRGFFYNCTYFDAFSNVWTLVSHLQRCYTQIRFFSSRKTTIRDKKERIIRKKYVDKGMIEIHLTPFELSAMIMWSKIEQNEKKKIEIGQKLFIVSLIYMYVCLCDNIT